MSVPAVSVLMAVRDGAPWVGEAVASVLAQTAGDLELIVIDDGSADATPEILGRVRDERLRVDRRAAAGLTPSLNRALALARAPLVARLDADDFALPDRLARQQEYLSAHPDVGLLGGGVREIDASGREVAVRVPPASDTELRAALIRRNPFAHSAVILRRALVDRVGGYDESVPVAQDYDLWMRLARITRLASLPEVVVVRRLVAGRVSATRDDARLQAETRIRWRAVRGGDYPWWCAVYALRPAAALAVPLPLRRRMRRALGGAAGA